ncbi:MAG: zinc finger domain-containing protein, partial [Candidatus Liptonbacteria bacterium]|nr:zinc finger domain-containing protein [Candidatus Liptonbacteria bacterium]
GLAEAGSLVLAIKRVLNEGIKKGGFTLRDYRHVDGSFGYYQKSRKVYDREGEKCLWFDVAHHRRCRGKIRRMKVNGRSSYFCSRCQK